MTPGQRRSVISHRLSGCWGYPDQACRLMEEAFATARQISHSGSIGQVHYLAGVCFAELLRDPQHSHTTWMRQSCSIANMGLRGPASRSSKASHRSSKTSKPRASHLRAKAAPMPANGGERRTYFLGRLATAYAQVGEVDRASQTIVEAQAVSERTGEHSWMPSCAALPGRFWLRNVPLPETPRRFFSRPSRSHVGKARRVFELRAALSLARLLIDRGRSGDARDLLAPIYSDFSEGFDTSDLRDVRTLSVDLGARSVAENLSLRGAHRRGNLHRCA